MTPRVVIDTNVLVSALWSSDKTSPIVRIYDALLDGGIIPLYCDGIIAEYEDVLHRDRFGFDAGDVACVMRHIKDCGVEIVPVEPSGDIVFPDDDDKVFYCAALAAQSEGAVLVTGNKRHFPAADFVLTPSEFVSLHSPLI